MRKLLLTFASLALLGLAAPLMAAEALTDEAAAMLAFMREEEKLAHDVYLLFSEMYAGEEAGAKIFARIAESEQRHTDAVKGLLEAYGMPDPAAGRPRASSRTRPAGPLRDAREVGSAGFTEALGVGVMIEQKDMTDIVDAIELSVAYADIVQVYSNLLAGSEHHLAAFLKVLGTAEPGAASLSTGKH